MTASEIIAWCQTYMANLLDVSPNQIGPDADISDLGLDSAAAVSMILDLEAKLGRELDPAILFEYPTLRALADVLAQPTPVAN